VRDAVLGDLWTNCLMVLAVNGGLIWSISATLSCNIVAEMKLWHSLQDAVWF